MEWSRIKTILIWVFAIVNIFLLSIYFKEANTGKTLDKEVIISTIEILRQNNISIDEDVLPDSFENVKVCSVENECADINSMLENTKLDKNSVTVDGNSFVYKPKEQIQRDDVEDMLKNAGLITTEEYKKVESDGYEYYYLKSENKVFFDSCIRVKIADGEVEEIYGKNWLKDRISEDGVAEIVSPAEILIDFSAQYDGTDRITVNSVTAGYYIGERTGNVKTTASPAWEISVSDGRKLYYDMRNGDLLK